MDADYKARIAIKLKLYTDGFADSFQKLFSDIMVKINPDFTRFRAYGSDGDGGNDSYIPKDCHYFQCYGPTIHSQEVTPHDKAKTDFKKLLEAGAVIRKWSFVFNDYYSGEYNRLINTVNEIKNNNNLESADIIKCDEIERLFLQLPTADQDIIAPLLYIVPKDIDTTFNSDVMSKVIKHLFSKIDLHRSNRLIGTNEELVTKIKLNKLSDDVANRLLMYSRYISIVDDFLAVESSMFDKLADYMKNLYSDVCKNIAGNTSLVPDLRYYTMLSNLLPTEVNTLIPALKNQYVICADIIMAKYFEACDIYEHYSYPN